MDYTIKIFARNALSSALKRIKIQLVGEKEKSDWTWSSGLRSLLGRGESSLTLTCSKPLGKLLCVNLQKEQILDALDEWFIEKLEVTAKDTVFKFPIYHWMKRNKIYSFNEGKALKPCESDLNPSTSQIRENEKTSRAEKYRWKEYKEGLPRCMDVDDVSHLPSEVQFSVKKTIDFGLTAVEGQLGAALTTHRVNTEQWKDFNAIKEMTTNISNNVTQDVMRRWEDDVFFGYQFLNGVNPIKIRCIKFLPEKFPVTKEMVNMDLKGEMENGNIFLCDYKHLKGAKPGEINGEKQYLTAPLVLLHKTSTQKLVPIAIQLKQEPGKDNPIFLPTDPHYDWLLAKTYVRSAYFNEHQLNAHLLRTHLMAEVFTVSLLRNTTKVHPIYKLLVPHTRYTLQINLLARQKLISEKGIFTTFAAASDVGMITILQNSMEDLTYSSLCIKDDIKERGLESMPFYYYRDDGFRLWDVIEKFVRGIVTHYYKSDKEIEDDPDLNDYVMDIFELGFLEKRETGFSTVDELVKFVTMVIFTGSAQHAAVNNGQFDFGSWMPNYPTSLQCPPPTTKGEATEQTLLNTFPDVNTTAQAVSVLSLLTTQSTDFVPLGQYPYEFFTEDVPKKLMTKFCEDLATLEKNIDVRNKGLRLPYTYLKPSQMENSVAI